MLNVTHVSGTPPLTGRIRTCPGDFIVHENLGFTATGDGEHVLLLLEKTDANTAWVARQLAAFAGVRVRDIGFAGRKDRHAVTRQSFSVWLPGKDMPDWQDFNVPGVRILEVARHARKLKQGALAGNHFELVIRDVTGDHVRAESVLLRMRSQGVPNYFGSQRFGREGGNIAHARAMFAGERVRRNERSLYLSAARSHVFNAVLSHRVMDGTWHAGQVGDVWNLDGSRAWFRADTMDASLRARLAAGDVHPTGPLWGKGELPVAGAVHALECNVAQQHADLTRGLIAAGLEQSRRALRVMPRALDWQWLADRRHLALSFDLPAGAYATAVLMELIRVVDHATCRTIG